jgi:glycerol-3-phosphate dehydrogenase (NAD(P)+)
MDRVAIIGGGAWGTALAAVARRNGLETSLWAREPEVVAAINDSASNPLFLPGITLPEGIQATTNFTEAIAGAETVFLVPPAQHLRDVARALAPALRRETPVVICAKGIEQDTCALLSEVAAEELPGAHLAVLSGPTFAGEVARGLPAAVTVACHDLALGRRIAATIGSPTFRPYVLDDVVGAQIGGAVKNVLAIATGVTTGRGLGDNARAALITRGLAETVRLGRAKGARLDTLMGLSGLGDLTLTCTSEQSRNTSFGIELGRGRAPADILQERRAVTEGFASAAAVVDLAGRLGVEMPICEAVNGVCHHGVSVDDAIRSLLTRAFRDEHFD